MSNKPQQVLSELEREPLAYFGCTWSEIRNSATKALVLGFIIGISISALLLFVGLKPAIAILLIVLITMVASIILAVLMLKNIAKHRAGKPLFYEVHRTTHRRSIFVQPQNIRYQRERNR